MHGPCPQDKNAFELQSTKKSRIQADVASETAQSDDTSETVPLITPITDGCKFDHKTGTIVLTMQLVVDALGLSDQKAIKHLKMEQEYITQQYNHAKDIDNTIIINGRT